MNYDYDRYVVTRNRKTGLRRYVNYRRQWVYHFYRSDYRSVLVGELTVPEIAEKFGWRNEEIDAAELTAGGIREAVPGGWG